MGKITEYNDLSLDEKLSYWEDYLERLVAYSMSRRQIPMREELTREIVRIRKIIEVFNPSIPNMYMESKMGVDIPTEPSVNPISKIVKKKLPKKDKENYTKVYRYRYDKESDTFIEDADRSKET